MFMKYPIKQFELRLTVTKVVFEWKLKTTCVAVVLGLTVTKVVFEFESNIINYF